MFILEMLLAICSYDIPKIKKPFPSLRGKGLRSHAFHSYRSRCSCTLHQVSTLVSQHVHAFFIRNRLLGFIGPVPPPTRDKSIRSIRYLILNPCVMSMVHRNYLPFFHLIISITKKHIFIAEMKKHTQKCLNSIDYYYQCVILIKTNKFNGKGRVFL